MIKELEHHSVKEDIIAGSVTNVIAVADDVAPAPCDVLLQKIQERLSTGCNSF